MNIKRIVKPAVWTFYVIIVFEILFMISPFALYFYSAYGPTLDFLERWSATAWLTKFYLPHFSMTTSPLLNMLHPLAAILMLFGSVIFLGGAVSIYWTKFRGGGLVTGGLYRFIRHPQYAGLAIIGAGTALLWPRLAVLIGLVTMLFLYTLLASWEEEHCVSQFGRGYRDYRVRTGMFLPVAISRRLPRLPNLFRPKNLAAAIGTYLFAIVIVVAAGFALRNYSLSHISARFTTDAAILSPALLSPGELQTAYRAAADDTRVKAALNDAGARQLIVYVVPRSWHLPDIPLSKVRPRQGHGGHITPENFDRRYYKVLFTRALTHSPDATGRDIVIAAYGRKTLVTAYVDLSGPRVTRIETPPAHVMWGDIPTPMF